MSKQIFYATERGKKDIGWLKSSFTFSFSDYQWPTRSSFGTLVAFNDDTLLPANGFGIHPHQNMEIISILLQGKMNHKDSMGYNTEIEPVGVQIMSAGKGLFHEEHNVGANEVKFLQIWIQPKLQNIQPRYQQRQFDMDILQNRLTTVVSHEEGLRHCWINQNAKISMGFFDSGKRVDYAFDLVNKCVFVYVIAGVVAIDNDTLQQGDGIGIWAVSSIHMYIKANTQLVIVETVINQK
jgi:quercetin 2,3-dioxygenase